MNLFATPTTTTIEDATRPVWHFHVHSSGSGCDGPVESERVVIEFAGETGRLAWTKYVSLQTEFFGRNDEYGPQTMRRWKDEDGQERFIIGGPADEGGYDWLELNSCTMAHCTSPRYRVHYRDYYAEAAGY